MCIGCIVGIVDCRKNTPTPINLRVVPVDFRDEQKYGKEEQGEGEGGYEWVGGDVEYFESLKIRDVLEYSLR